MPRINLKSNEISRKTAIGLLQIGEKGDELHPNAMVVYGPVEQSLQSPDVLTLEEKLASVGTSRDALSASSAFETMSISRAHKNADGITGEASGLSGEVIMSCYLDLTKVERIAGMSMKMAKSRLPSEDRRVAGTGVAGGVGGVG
jgi:hypothetical protein